MNNSDLWHMVSVSGGKDSTALVLLARERGVVAELVFADTQHEHPLTYEYLEYLDKAMGPIRVVKADFARVMEGKRRWIESHWYDDLTAGRPGQWEWRGDPEERPENEPPKPRNEYASALAPPAWKWRACIRPYSPERARAKVAEALEALKPTGNLFLDLALWKGRFPSTRRRFCSEQLKHEPLRRQVVEPMQAQGKVVVSWQGVRAAESPNRAKLDIVDHPEPQLIQYRPIIAWTANEIFAMHRRYGIKWNPLYEQGMGRVGCMPCIHANKREMSEIAKRWPEVIDRIEAMEREASKCSKYSIATFGDVRNIVGDACVDYHDVSYQDHGIREYVRWAQTERGGDRRQEKIDFGEDVPVCSSIYGLCESAD